MSIELPDAVTLVPSSSREEGLSDKIAYSLDPRQGILLQDKYLASLYIGSTSLAPEYFKVETIFANIDPDKTGELEFTDWDLRARHGLMRPDGRFRYLLLGPTIIDGSLYGGEIIPDEEMTRKFGLVEIKQDEEDWLLKITMPTHPYRTLSKLSITQTL